jgi:hypothetical protein
VRASANSARMFWGVCAWTEFGDLKAFFRTDQKLAADLLKPHANYWASKIAKKESARIMKSGEWAESPKQALAAELARPARSPDRSHTKAAVNRD